MSAISFTVDDAAISDVLRKLSGVASSKEMRSAMDDVGETVVRSVRRNFENMRTPWGERWMPLSRATIMGRLRGNKKNFLTGKKTKGQLSKQGIEQASGNFEILRDKGTLFSAISAQPDGDGVVIGVGGGAGSGKSAKGYAAAQQFGRPEMRLPARPYMPIRSGSVDLPPGLREEILDTIGDSLARVLGK